MGNDSTAKPRTKKPLKPLSIAAQSLLPDPDQAFRCSTFTASLGVSPAGSAISADVVAVVDTPLPWPKPVFDHSHLAGTDSTLVAPDGRRVKVLAAVPRSDSVGEDQHFITAFFQVKGGALSVKVALGHRSADAVLAELLRVDDPFSLAGSWPGPSRAVLVCTQGTHDVCCGTEGSALVSALDDDERFEEVDLLRVSHTGGHRFAPTAMTFPDGRMWAFVGPDQLATALFHDASPASIAPWCRGSWQAATPIHQAAEVATFGRCDWSELGDLVCSDERDGSATTQGAPAAQVVSVIRPGRADRVRISVSREIPVIRCRAEGGLPAKLSSEYLAEVL